MADETLTKDLRSLQGECPSGTTSEPVVIAPQGSAGESPALFPYYGLHSDNCWCWDCTLRQFNL